MYKQCHISCQMAGVNLHTLEPTWPEIMEMCLPCSLDSHLNTASLWYAHLCVIMPSVCMRTVLSVVAEFSIDRNPRPDWITNSPWSSLMQP